MSNLLGVLNKIESHVPKPFLAPIPQANVVSCFTIQENIPYWFNLKEPSSGWWWVKPLSKTRAELDRPAYPYEYLGYLNKLPRFIVITIEQLHEGILVVPYNSSDAQQRGWVNSEPKYVYLPRNHYCPPLSILIVRNMAGILLFDNYYPIDFKDQSFNPETLPKKKFEVAWQIAFQRLEEKCKRESLKTEKGQIEDRLNFVGAKLVDYKKEGSNFDVTYAYNGAVFTVNIRPDMRVESAGICLSDEDSNYDLGAICLVMEEARRLRRPGIREEYYL